MNDLIIVGGGPAGLSAAIYGMRAGLQTVLVEKFSPGGQMMNTAEIENYPGFAEPVAGWDLVSAMENQARRLGITIDNREIIEIRRDMNGHYFDLICSDGETLRARSVIAATGAALKKLGVPGEAELTGRGVSYCATCDGAFFKEKTVAVVGGGDSALEEAIFLTRFASRVILVHRRDRFRAAKILQDRALGNGKITPIYDSIITAIQGTDRVNAIIIRNVNTGQISEVPLDGVFIFIGYVPNTGMLPPSVLNPAGEAVVDLRMRTAIPGLFAAGDLRAESVRQIVAATSDGAIAALGAYAHIESMGS